MLEENTDKVTDFDYVFSEKEILALAKFLRKKQSELPVDIEDFARKVELYIYNRMSLEEVIEFYK